MPEMISEYQMSLDFDQDDDFAELDALDEDFCEVEPQVDPDDTASHKRARVIPIRGNGQFDLRSTDDRTPASPIPTHGFPICMQTAPTGSLILTPSSSASNGAASSAPRPCATPAFSG